MSRALSVIIFLCISALTSAQDALSEAQLTRIEVAFEYAGNETVHRWHDLRYVQHDAYTGEESELKASRVGNGLFLIQMRLRHTVYDVLTEKGRAIPFCVEPGDFLVITVRPSGEIRYQMADKGRARYERLMLHDISRRTWYSSTDFEEDRGCGSFRQFISRIVERMDRAVGEVNSVALEHQFTQEEKEIAIDNVRMQFGVWMLEYPSWKSIQLALFASRDDAGWQMPPEQEEQMREIVDPRNYAFMRLLPLTDRACMASPHFPTFMQSYSHTPALTHDQYLYHGSTRAAHAQMDSAMVAHEKAMTRLHQPSVFLETALLQRRLERQPEYEKLAAAEQRLDTANSIILPDVEVLSNTLRQRGMTLSEEEELLVALNNAPIAFNPLAPILYLISKYIVEPYQRKHPGKKARARMRRDEILRKYAESDAEYARLVKACEEAQREKANKRNSK